MCELCPWLDRAASVPPSLPILRGRLVVGGGFDLGSSEREVIGAGACLSTPGGVDSRSGGF